MPAGSFGAVRVRHREYIQDVTGTGNAVFNIEAFGINPGDAGTFPWLSNLASQFEEYRFNSLKFIYNTVSSDTFTGGATNLGTIIMCTQYNSLNPPFTGKNFMENYEGSVSGKPSLNLTHMVDVRHGLTPYQLQYVRQNHFTISPIYGNLLQYDVGQFYLANQSCAGNQLGELWIEYDITLLKPKLNPSASLRSPPCDFINCIGPFTNSTAAVFATPANWFPTPTVGQAGIGSQLTFSAINGQQIVFPPEDPAGTVYTVWLYALGSVVAATTWGWGVPTVGGSMRFLSLSQNVATAAIGDHSQILTVVQRTAATGAATLNIAVNTNPTTGTFLAIFCRIAYASQLDAQLGAANTVNGWMINANPHLSVPNF